MNHNLLLSDPPKVYSNFNSNPDQNFILLENPESRKDNALDFSKIYLLFYSKLVRFATVFVVYEEDAENIIQDLFLGLWECKDSLKCIENINAYMYKLTKHKCLDHLKHKMVEDRFVVNAQSLYEQEVSLKLQSLDNFDVELAAEERIEKIVSKAVDSLPPKCRRIFILSRYDGLKYKEIADKLSISVNTVETQMCIALKKLRNSLHILLN
jgi:RNA polymerase sigma-70 factor (ECF subfamily)